ncbi:MAG: hypothetical protein HYZ07_00610 [Candidatus Harrisonbacteria bacterium]|nr:hypothetical protein [Candidatus Harrisonbacteria bacterium]
MIRVVMDDAAPCKNFFVHHWIAVFFAVVAGSIIVSPQLLAIRALGDEYRGIHLLTTDDNAYYVARMRDILDGHKWVSSPFIYEYKNSPPLLYPVGEYLYMWPALFLGVPLVAVLIFAKFFFPAALFALIYALLFALTEGIENGARKLTAVAGGLLATLGYGLVDYKSVLPVLSGTAHFFAWSLWARPVNPVTGAILLFTFLLLLWRIMNRGGIGTMIFAGIIFSLMFGYFFTWGMALSIVGMFGVIALAERNYGLLKRLALMLGVGFLAAVPYWYNMRLVANTTESESLYLQNGLIFTHAPIANKVVFLALLIFIPCFIAAYRKRSRVRLGGTDGAPMKPVWWFTLALLLGGAWSLNQQVITGRTIWPYHFVQYTTPLAIVAVFAALCIVFRPRFPRLWAGAMVFLSALSLVYGISAARTYAYQLPEFRSIQQYSGVLAWLKDNAERDCVVLVAEGVEEKLTRLIPGFTQCNSYVAGWMFASVHENTRVLHNFLTLMHLDGVTAESAEAYLNEHKRWAHDYFYRNWNDFLSFDERWADEVIAARVNDFKEFMKIDFVEALKRYRIDYIAFEGPPKDSVYVSLHRPPLIGEFSGVYLYKM